MKRRTFTKTAILGTAGVMAGGLPAMAQQEKFGSKELIAAAEKEGGLTYYTANFAEVEQEVIKEFNKTFPKIKVSMVRAPGGQLITRIKTEAAADKLARRRHRPLRPRPDAGDDRPVPGLHAAQRRRLPARRAGLAQAVARRHARLGDRLQHPAGEERAQDLDGSHQARIQGQADRPGGRPVGRHHLDPRMFERQVLGEDYWAKQAALGIALYPSGAPLSDALVRGEVSIAPLLYNIIYTKIVEGAPAEAIFAPEGVPIIPYADGIPKSSKNPNAAKLFMNWRLSKEGQAFQIAKLGNITSLKDPPSFPKGWDPKVIKVWVPNYDQFEKLREPWLEQWNKTYGYRQ